MAWRSYHWQWSLWRRVPRFELRHRFTPTNLFLVNARLGEVIALKKLRVPDPEKLSKLQKEIRLLSHLDHPNIVHYLGCQTDDGGLLNVFLEYCPGGSLKSLISKFGTLDDLLIKVYTKQIVKGLEYIHSLRIVHRDIKCANVRHCFWQLEALIMLTIVGPRWQLCHCKNNRLWSS
jgi:serine/threonine protein kinase